MIEAIPIDKNGHTIGCARNFPNSQWETMICTFGKKLRWRLVKEKEELVKESDEERIWADSNSESDSFDEEKIFEYNLDVKSIVTSLTKRELIKKYGLPEELMKSTKPEIIEIIKSGELYK